MVSFLLFLCAEALAQETTPPACVVKATDVVVLAQDAETGERYLVSDETHEILGLSRDCIFEEGAQIRLYVVDLPTAHLKNATKIMLTVTPPCSEADAWISTNLTKATKHLVEGGVPADAVLTTLAPCSTSPSIRGEVIDVQKDK